MKGVVFPAYCSVNSEKLEYPVTFHIYPYTIHLLLAEFEVPALSKFVPCWHMAQAGSP